VRAIPLIIGVAIGNFLVQATLGEDWALAADRTFYQAVALFVAAYLWK